MRVHVVLLKPPILGVPNVKAAASHDFHGRWAKGGSCWGEVLCVPVGPRSDEQGEVLRCLDRGPHHYSIRRSDGDIGETIYKCTEGTDML